MAIRTYTVSFAAVSISAAQDLFEITAAAGKTLRIAGLFLGQYSDFGDAQDELLSIAIKSGQTVSGSGGSAPTPVPTGVTDVAAGFSAEVNNTTKANTGTIVTHHSDVWVVRGGNQWWFPENYRVELTGGRRATVELVAAPADAITANGTLYVEEMG